jgi:hypothetical protein
VGQRLLLEVAREHGLHAIGVDLCKRRCRHAQRFNLEKLRRSVAARRLSRNRRA